MAKLDTLLKNPSQWVVTIKDVMHVMDTDGNACCMDSEPDQRKFLSALAKWAGQIDEEGIIDNETDEDPDEDLDDEEDDDNFDDRDDYDPES